MRRCRGRSSQKAYGWDFPWQNTGTAKYNNRGRGTGTADVKRGYILGHRQFKTSVLYHSGRSCVCQEKHKNTKKKNDDVSHHTTKNTQDGMQRNKLTCFGRIAREDNQNVRHFRGPRRKYPSRGGEVRSHLEVQPTLLGQNHLEIVKAIYLQ